MRIRLCSSSLWLAILLRTIKAITLTQFQPISGFTDQCTKAYNTPLSACSTSDFQSGGSCSTGCISFLQQLTQVINTQCKGISAFPNTLIGLFFAHEGVSTLCPNSVGSSGGSSGNLYTSQQNAQPSYSQQQPTSMQSSSLSPSPTTNSPSSSSSPTTSTKQSSRPTSSSSQSTSLSSTPSSSSVQQQNTISTSYTPTAASTAPTKPKNTPSSSSTESIAPSNSSPPKPNNAQTGGDGTILGVGPASSNAPTTRRSTTFVLWTCAIAVAMFFHWSYIAR